MRRVEAISNLNTVCTFRSLHQHTTSAFHLAEKSDLSVVNLVLSANSASTASSSEAITVEGKEMLITPFNLTPLRDLKMV